MINALAFLPLNIIKKGRNHTFNIPKDIFKYLFFIEMSLLYDFFI